MHFINYSLIRVFKVKSVIKSMRTLTVEYEWKECFILDVALSLTSSRL